MRAGCAPFAFAVTADSGPTQSRRWHPARNTRHGPIRKAAAAAAAACLRAGFSIGSYFRRGRGVLPSRRISGKPLRSLRRLFGRVCQAAVKISIMKKERNRRSVFPSANWGRPSAVFLFKPLVTSVACSDIKSGLP